MQNIQQPRLLCPFPKRSARCKPSHKGEKELRPDFPTGYGFLKHAFAPIRVVPECASDETKVIESMSTALNNINAFYNKGFSLSKSLPFPECIAKMLNDVQSGISTQTLACQVSIAINGNFPTILVKTSPAYFGSTLYYIDILPFITALEERKYAMANLLAAIFSYLRHVQHISLYRENTIGNHYECLLEEMETALQDGEDRSEWSALSPVAYADSAEKRLLKRLRNKRHLLALERRAMRFQPENNQENALKSIAVSLVELFREYGTSAVADTVNTPKVEEDEQVLLFSELHSFSYHSKGAFQSIFMECINQSFQEISAVEDIVDCTYFNHLPPKNANFSSTYASRYLDLLAELSDILITL